MRLLKGESGYFDWVTSIRGIYLARDGRIEFLFCANRVDLPKINKAMDAREVLTLVMIPVHPPGLAWNTPEGRAALTLMGDEPSTHKHSFRITKIDAQGPEGDSSIVDVRIEGKRL